MNQLACFISRVVISRGDYQEDPKERTEAKIEAVKQYRKALLKNYEDWAKFGGAPERNNSTNEDEVNEDDVKDIALWHLV